MEIVSDKRGVCGEMDERKSRVVRENRTGLERISKKTVEKRAFSTFLAWHWLC